MTHHSIVSQSLPTILFLIPLIPRLLHALLLHYCCTLATFASPTSHHHHLKFIDMHPYPRRSTPFKPAARIRGNARPDYKYVDPFTLQLLSAQALKAGSAQAQLIVLPKEMLTSENVGHVTTFILLRLRAMTVRATYKHH